MATLRKRGTKWQVFVRREGYPHLSKTFQLKEDAARWGREQDRLIDIGQPISSSTLTPPLPKHTFADLLARYETDVLPRKRSKGATDKFHLRVIGRHRIAETKVENLSSSVISEFREDRLKQVSKWGKPVSPSTVRKELGLILHMLKIAENEWGIELPIIKTVTKPSPARGRDRRLSEEDAQIINDGLANTRNPYIKYAFNFAISTGMRRGEILSLTWKNIDLTNRVAFLPMTKNGEPRSIPLSSSAINSLLEAHKINEDAALCFPISSNALTSAWKRIKARCKLKDLHFHDLRHEAISRFFEMGLSVAEVQLISGHKDVRMLFRYTHLKAEQVAQKLK